MGVVTRKLCWEIFLTLSPFKARKYVRLSPRRSTRISPAVTSRRMPAGKAEPLHQVYRAMQRHGRLCVALLHRRLAVAGDPRPLGGESCPLLQRPSTAGLIRMERLVTAGLIRTQRPSTAGLIRMERLVTAGLIRTQRPSTAGLIRMERLVTAGLIRTQRLASSARLIDSRSARTRGTLRRRRSTKPRAICRSCC